MLNIWGIKDAFWEQVCLSWCEYNYYSNFRVENQVLWYNTKLKIKGKPFLWADSLRRGLKFVYQLFSQCTFKSYEQVREEFGLSQLRYNSLKSIIPREWKDYFESSTTETFLPLPPHNFDMAVTLYRDSLSRRVYRFLAGDVILIHNKYISWYKELGERNYVRGFVSLGNSTSILPKLPT